MPWLRLRADSERKDAEALGDRLRDSGAVAVSLAPRDENDNSVLEPPLHATRGQPLLWPTVRVEALFPVDADLSALPRLDCDIDFMADENWAETWRANVAELRFGRLRVVPASDVSAAGGAPASCGVSASCGVPASSGVPASGGKHRSEAVPGEATVRLDPGLAFGTGTHPSTALCLAWLADQDLAGKRVLDVGAGSGILAIAALRLGARQALAVDHDPQARRACERNARANDVSLGIASELEATTGTFDIAVANIVADVLCQMAPALCARTPKLALSGILARQTAQVRRAYPRVAFQPPLAKDGWVLLAGDRHG